jgi:hypothetical protein
MNRAEWLGQVADEYMAAGLLPFAGDPGTPQNLSSIYAARWPADDSPAAEIRFTAYFSDGAVILTSRKVRDS